MDGRDPECVHLLLRSQGRPVGCARLRPLGDARARSSASPWRLTRRGAAGLGPPVGGRSRPRRRAAAGPSCGCTPRRRPSPSTIAWAGSTSAPSSSRPASCLRRCGSGHLVRRRDAPGSFHPSARLRRRPSASPTRLVARDRAVVGSDTVIRTRKLPMNSLAFDGSLIRGNTVHENGNGGIRGEDNVTITDNSADGKRDREQPRWNPLQFRLCHSREQRQPQHQGWNRGDRRPIARGWQPGSWQLRFWNHRGGRRRIESKTTTSQTTTTTGSR